MSSMPAEMSTPMTLSSGALRAASMAKSAVPVATSRIFARDRPGKEHADRLAPPQLVDAEGEEMVQEIIAVRDVVKHLRHLRLLGVSAAVRGDRGAHGVQGRHQPTIVCPSGYL